MKQSKPSKTFCTTYGAVSLILGFLGGMCISSILHTTTYMKGYVSKPTDFSFTSLRNSRPSSNSPTTQSTRPHLVPGIPAQSEVSIFSLLPPPSPPHPPHPPHPLHPLHPPPRTVPLPTSSTLPSHRRHSTIILPRSIQRSFGAVAPAPPTLLWSPRKDETQDLFVVCPSRSLCSEHLSRFPPSQLEEALRWKFRIVYVIEERESRETTERRGSLLSSSQHVDVAHDLVAVMRLDPTLSSSLEERMLEKFARLEDHVEEGVVGVVEEEKENGNDDNTIMSKKKSSLLVRLTTNTFFVPSLLAEALSQIDGRRDDLWFSDCSKTKGGSNVPRSLDVGRVFITSRNSLKARKKTGEMPSCTKMDELRRRNRIKKNKRKRKKKKKDRVAAEESNEEKNALGYEAEDETDEKVEDEGEEDEGEEDEGEEDEGEEEEATEQEMETHEDETHEIGLHAGSDPLCIARGGWDPLGELETHGDLRRLHRCAIITSVLTRHDWLFTWDAVYGGAAAFANEIDEDGGSGKTGEDFFSTSSSVSSSLLSSRPPPCTVSLMLTCSPEDIDKRQSVRLTWGSNAWAYGVRVIFQIERDQEGEGREGERQWWLETALESESSMHGDLKIVRGKNRGSRFAATLEENDKERRKRGERGEEGGEEGIPSREEETCSYYYATSIDTYVRPYQLVSMLDHIESGDQSSIHPLHNTKKRRKKRGGGGGHGGDGHKGGEEDQKEKSEGSEERCKSGTCNCDWSTEEVCKHPDANDGSSCYLECCCPYLPGLPALPSEISTSSSSSSSSSSSPSDTIDNSASDGSKSVPKYMWLHNSAPENIPRDELRSGLGREGGGGGELVLVVTSKSDERQTLIMSRSLVESVSSCYVEQSLLLEQQKGKHHLVNNIFDYEWQLEKQKKVEERREEEEKGKKRIKRQGGYGGQENEQKEKEEEELEQLEQETESKIIERCIETLTKPVMIVVASPMSQHQSCKPRTVATERWIDGNGLVFIDWNVYLLQEAEMRGSYCSVLNGGPQSPKTAGDKEQEWIRALKHNGGNKIEKQPPMLTSRPFQFLPPTPTTAPWESIQSELGPTTYIFSLGVDATRDHGWAAKSAHHDRGGRQIRHRWERMQRCGLGGTRGEKCQVIVTKCVNCQGAWYNTMWRSHQPTDSSSLKKKTSSSSSVMVATHIAPVLLPGSNKIIVGRSSLTKLKFDVAVPFACEWKRLAAFFKRFPAFPRKDVNVRLMITNYPCPDGSSKSKEVFTAEVARGVNLPLENIVIVDIHDPKFARAAACNALHGYARSDAILLVIDVDMEVHYNFFLHAEMYVRAGVSAYFPIVWSRFSPASIRLVEKFRGARIGRLSDYEGMWRPFGYGNYAIHGSDAMKLQMDDTIVGWGGEDNDFHKRCSGIRHVIRMHEPDLVHLWHDKDCSVVDTDRKKACVGSLASVEGSGLALYLQMHRIKRECGDARDALAAS